jgi:hypothetical protein
VKTWTIQSRLVRAEIQSLGAMLGPTWFSLGSREVQPLAVAPWADEVGPEYEKLPRILRRLRGEWPCVPFGMAEPRPDLPREWILDESSPCGYIDPNPHGFSSNAEWELMCLEPKRIELGLEYPKCHPITRVTRTITVSEDAPALQISLLVQAREACDLPIGVHPVLRLPEKPGTASLHFDTDVRGWTSPTPFEPGISKIRPNVRDVPLTKVPCVCAAGENKTQDVTRLPLNCETEELILVLGHNGMAMLTNHDERYSVALSWDQEMFPACLLWLSNRGRGYCPWNRRFLGLGVEPIRSAFDLGVTVSQSRCNPLWRSGIPCTYTFSPAQDLETKYSIAVVEAGASRDP